jgi:hypothetical protein
MDPDGNTITRQVHDGICKDCTILRGRAGLTDQTGEVLSIGSGLYLHHIGVLPNKMSLSPQIVQTTCPSFLGLPQMGLPDMLFVQGVENFTTWYTAEDGSINSGYYAPTDGWGMIMEVVNYKPVAKDVYISFDYDYVPGKPERRAKVSYVSVTGCLMTGQMDMPVGGFKVQNGNKTTVAGKEMEILESGTFLSQRGHMHDGGDMLKLYINGKEVCESKAEYGGAESTLVGADGKKWETINAMTECNKPVHVNKGDKLRIDALFDTIAHPV